jgi:ATP-dependent helicase HrpA
VSKFQPSGRSLTEELGKFIRTKYGVDVPPNAWPENALPSHLRPRVEIVAEDNGKLIASGRDFSSLKEKLKEKPVEKPRGDDPAWTAACSRWERFGLRSWSFGDLPESISINEHTTAYPGLAFQEGEVSLRLFRAQELARRSSIAGVRRLVELEIGKDLAWAQKDLRGLVQMAPLCQTLCSAEDLQRSAMENVKRYVLPGQPLPSLTEAEFRKAVTAAKERVPGLAQRVIDATGTILQLRAQVLQRLVKTATAPAAKPASKTLNDLRSLSIFVPPASTQRPSAATPQSMISADLARLLPPNFLEAVPFERLVHIPRYLKAMLLRAERASVNPLKDAEKAVQLIPFSKALEDLAKNSPSSEAGTALAEDYKWLVEEFKVSLFAQELGTIQPVSANRLNALLEKIRGA